MAKLPTRKAIFYIKGEAQVNEDGESRQNVLFVAEPGSAIILQREPDNQYDSNAIAVTLDGKKIGYLSKEDAEIIAPHLDAQRTYKSTLHRITRGVWGAENYGVAISIAWDGKDTLPFEPLDEAQRRFKLEMALKTKKNANSSRDDKGRFIGQNAKSKNGCQSSFFVILIIPVVIFSTIFIAKLMTTFL